MDEKEKLLLILLLALIIAASSPVQGESWKDAAKKAAVDYGSKKTTEFVSEKLEGQLQELLKDLKWWPGMKGGKNPYYMALNATATNSAKLKEIADGLASDDPAEVNKAQEELALGFGKAVSSVAGKSVGKQALNTLIGNKKDVAEIASVLGSAAGGDTQAGMEFIGSKIIDMTPIGEVVDFYKTAYGVMKYGVDKFETAQLEELYQKYRTGKISEEELKSDLGNPPYLSLVVHSHNIELRNQREEMLKSFMGTIDDQLYRHLTEVNDEQTIDDVVSVMKERKNKEEIDKVKAETKAESESQAKEILSALEDELKAKYGSDWEIKGSSYNLDKFIERTIELYDANKGLISLQQAASIMAKKLVYGQNSLEYNKLASTNLPLARVSFSKDAVINRSKIIAGQGAIVTPGFSVSRGFGFKEGPVDTPCQPSINGVIGEVPAPGSLNASIDSGSKVPGTWSLYNANTGLHIYFEPKYGKAYGPADDILSLGENSGSGDESKPYHVEGSANWPSPGRLTYVIAAPGGAGPLTGSCFKQSGSIKIKITSLKRETPAKNFDVLRDGDRLQTGSSEAVIRMPNGSELQVRPHSILSFTTTDKGTTRVEVKQGGFRISQPPGMKHDQEMKLGSKIIDPNRTEYFGQWDGSKGSLAVVEGNISVSDQNGTETALEAGQQMELPGGNISPYNLSTDDGGLVFGLPMRDLPVDDSLPEPSGYYEAAFSNGKIPKDWIWQDPGNDARIETPGNGTLRVTVPDGNDIWNSRVDAPRLMHKVTGDFDLEGQLLLESKGTDMAATEFILYSPGSYLGFLGGQMSSDGLEAHYRIIGGGWVKMQGINKLGSLNKELHDGPDAPDVPVKIKLTRRGDIWKTYWSLDGQSWNLSTRQEIAAQDTVWVGWSFKRMAYDGLRSEPANSTLSDVSLISAQNGSLEVPEWDLVHWMGTAEVENSIIQLALNGTTLGDVAAETGERFDGDLDAVVHFDTSNWTGQDGARRELNLFATNGDDKNYAYIGICQSGTDPQRYQTDLGINKGYGRYNWIKTSDLQGYLRIVRHDGNFSTYYWSECQWVPLGEFKTGFKDPVYIGVSIGNSYQAKKPVPLAVDFNVEQILASEAVSWNWTPTYCSLIQPVPLPQGITLQQGVEAKMFKPAFALGTIFFGPDGTAYAFSNEKGKQTLMAIDSSGAAHAYAESEILAGINRKTGVMSGSNVLMTVDSWADGGNRYGGIFELNPNGAFSQWNLKSSHKTYDIISAPDVGWYFSDVDNDNIWHLPGKGAAEEPSITKGDRSSRIGLIQLAYDSADETLYALDNYLDWRGAGTLRVCKITPDGELVEEAKINETSKMNGGMALSSSGPFSHALYVSDAAAGEILKVEGGTTKQVINGLIKPGEMQFNPLNGDLLIVCDEGKSLLWIGSNLSSVGRQEDHLDGNRVAHKDSPRGWRTVQCRVDVVLIPSLVE